MDVNILHIGNIANIAYASCRILDKFGHSIDLVCHDENHLMSQPEWVDLDLDPNDFPNENNFFDNSFLNKDAYQRPNWYKRTNIFNNNHLLIRKASSYLPVFVKKFLKPFYTSFFFSTSINNNSKFSTQSQNEMEEIRLESIMSKAYHDSKKWNLTKADLDTYIPQAKWLYDQIQNQDYDICFAYAASPIYCLMASPKPYVAIEIGTLRDIPPEDVSGKLLALSYQKANYVLVTNPDARLILEKLGIEKYRFCPHPVDEDIYKPIINEEVLNIRNQFIKRNKVDLLIIAPARQNWKIKGNHKYLEAVKRLKEENIIVQLIIPLWGQDIKKTQDYAKKLGISSQINWIKPLPEKKLIKYFSAVDAVIDQFELGVFGFVTAKALACAAPILTSYDHEIHSWCFETDPPVLPCSSTEDLTRNLKKLLDQSYKESLKIQSREWFLKYHSSSIINKIMIEVTKEVLKGEKI